MNDFLTRLIPGFIYVSLLIGSLLYSQFLFVLLMFLFCLIIIFEYGKVLRNDNVHLKSIKEKNKLTEMCSGDYIFQIDADEIPHDILIAQLPTILESNPNNEVYLVPRVNTVKGLTKEYVQKWRWNVDLEDRVNWPDYQWRIWKNIKRIKWKNKVHEVLEGYKTYANLPSLPELALYHPKTIEKQEKQNSYYETL